MPILSSIPKAVSLLAQTTKYFEIKRLLPAIQLKEQGLETRLDSRVKGYVLAAYSEPSFVKLEEIRARNELVSEYSLVCAKNSEFGSVVLDYLSKNQSLQVRQDPKTNEWVFAKNFALKRDILIPVHKLLETHSPALAAYAERKKFVVSLKIKDRERIQIDLESDFYNFKIPMVKATQRSLNKAPNKWDVDFKARTFTTHIFIKLQDLIESTKKVSTGGSDSRSNSSSHKYNDNDNDNSYIENNNASNQKNNETNNNTKTETINGSKTTWDIHVKIVKGARMQVRLHMAFLGLPCTGDEILVKYMEDVSNCDLGVPEKKTTTAEYVSSQQELGFECNGFQIEGCNFKLK